MTDDVFINKGSSVRIFGDLHNILAISHTLNSQLREILKMTQHKLHLHQLNSLDKTEFINLKKPSN